MTPDPALCDVRVLAQEARMCMQRLAAIGALAKHTVLAQRAAGFDPRLNGPDDFAALCQVIGDGSRSLSHDLAL